MPPIHLSDLRKVESPCAEAARQPVLDGELLSVLVKLKPGADAPSYVAVRTAFPGKLFSTTVAAAELHRLNSDPTVVSVSVGRRLGCADATALE